MSAARDTAARLRTELDAHLVARDRASAVTSAIEAVRRGDISIPDLYTTVLAPLMMDTGAAWQSGDIEVWEEHFATATVYTIVDSLYPEVTRLASQATRNLGTVLLACPPEEEHDLGLRMLSDRFEIAGWKAYYLGANTPIEEIISAARTMNADLVVLSSSTHYHRVKLRECVSVIEKELGGVRVVVGGAAFLHGTGDWPQHNLFDERILAEGLG